MKQNLPDDMVINGQEYRLALLDIIDAFNVLYGEGEGTVAQFNETFVAFFEANPIYNAVITNFVRPRL